MTFFRMRNLRVLALFLCFSMALVAGSPTQSGAAGIPVMDLTNFTQNLISALQNIMSVVNDATRAANQGRQISNQVKSLTTLGGGLFNTVNGLANSNITELDSLVSTAQGINFNAGQVNTQFDTMFPQGTTWSNIPIDQFGGEFNRWTQNLSDAAKFSMQAQTVVNRVRENYRRMTQILNQANGAEGEVRQIQAANQSLGVVSSQLGDITQTLVAGQRVTSTTAAVAAAEKAAKHEAKARLRSGYADKGPAASTHGSLPQPN